MKDLGLSQEALADKLNIDRSYMGGIEKSLMMCLRKAISSQSCKT
jgi:transcriptional regulator with XRE-family HTH domain